MAITTEVARFIANTSYEDIPQEVLETIKHAIIDTLGVAFAGKDEDSVQIVKNFVADEGGNELATIWGRSNFKTSVTQAALVNGTMAHALDFDDLNAKATHAHPSASLVPTIIAVGQEINATGKNLLTAYYIGLEVMGYVGRMITYEHYKKGWHGTATIGVLGCLAAASVLYKLSSTTIEHAIGIAVSHISGTRQNFGTMTKPYHAGKAAHSGITAAKLASKGFTANQQALEAPLGFLQLYLASSEPNISAPIGQRIELLETKLTLKKYPCCYGSHRAIDAATNLYARGIAPQNIKQIVVTGPVNAFTPLIHTQPKTGLEGKFSLEFPIALVLYGERVQVSSFQDNIVQQKHIQQLMSKIIRVEDPSIYVETSGLDEGYVEVTITLEDGHILTERIFHPKGAVENPLTAQEIVEKFIACVGGVYTPNEATRFAEKLQRLETYEDLNEIFSYL